MIFAVFRNCLSQHYLQLCTLDNVKVKRLLNLVILFFITKTLHKISALKYFDKENQKILFCEIVTSHGNYQTRLPTPTWIQTPTSFRPKVWHEGFVSRCRCQARQEFTCTRLGKTVCRSDMMNSNSNLICNISILLVICTKKTV